MQKVTRKNRQNSECRGIEVDFIQHADVVENVMTKGGLEEKVKTAVDTVDVVEKMARTQDLDGNVVHTKDLIKAKSALHVLFSPESINDRGDLKEGGEQAMQELVEMYDLTNPKNWGNFW